MPASKDFTYMHTLFDLFRNVMNYQNLREHRLQVSHVSIICHLHHFEIRVCLGTIVHLFDQKQCILCSALLSKSYLTLHYVTSPRDSLCCHLTALCLREAACWQQCKSVCVVTWSDHQNCSD